MDMVTGAVVIAAMVAGVIVYAIYKSEKRAADERRIRHQEFEARLQPEHQETMAKVMASRDAEIAKATKKDPAPMINAAACEPRQIHGAPLGTTVED